MGNRNFHPALVPAESKLKLGRCSAAADLFSLAQVACPAVEILEGTSSSDLSSSFKGGPENGVTVECQPWHNLSGEISASASDHPKKTGVTGGVALSPILNC